MIRTLRLIQAVSGRANARQAIVIVWPSTKEVFEVARFGALAFPGSPRGIQAGRLFSLIKLCRVAWSPFAYRLNATRPQPVAHG